MEGTLLDNASLVRCNFEDAKLKPTSLLGAQMKGVNLEVGLLNSFTSLECGKFFPIWNFDFRATFYITIYG